MEDEFILDMLCTVLVGHQGDNIWKEVCNAGLNCKNRSGLEIFTEELVLLDIGEAKGLGVFTPGRRRYRRL